MTTAARTLADRLAATDDAALAELFAARRVPATVAWSDFFDAAAGLLDAAALDRVIVSLSRAQLDELAAGTSGDSAAQPGTPNAARDSLVSLALLDPDGSAYADVAAAVARIGFDSPDSGAAPAAGDAPASRRAEHPEEAGAAAERAFTSVAELADILIACLDAPIGRIGSGAMSATDRRRLVDGGAVRDAEEAEVLVGLAATADLLRAAGRAWLVTEEGVRWLDLGTAARWSAVATRFRDALPVALRSADGGWRDTSSWSDAYPLDIEWPGRSDRLIESATLWALLSTEGTPTPWAAALSVGSAADAASLVALLPRTVDRIYLQNDLTAIAPGPLEPALDLRLRTMAERESRAQASTYRFTADSISRAAAQGETAASLQEFLTALSLTGVPQPLAYLVERTTARHGLVRVSIDPDSGRTRITSDDAHVLDTIAVDQSLRSIGIVRDGDALGSRVARDAVYWSLVDARYPAIAEDADGMPEHPRRRRLAPHEDAPTNPMELYAPLIHSLRASHGTDADSAWLGRELDVAVRTKSIVVVLVALPDGSSREFTLEATGLGGGRLRGRDRGSDVERTLPVSSIVSVRPAG